MNPLKSLLTALLLAAATAGAAQTDVTGQFLSNADFTDGAMEANAPRGWTLELSSSGVQSKISTAEKADGTIAGNQNHWQLWQPSGQLTGKACQQISQLPAGRYRLTAVVSASFGGTVELYLNDSATPIPTGKAGTYEVEALIADGNAELGLALNVTGGGTIDFDSFRLYRYEPEPGDLALLLEAWHKQCVDDTLAEDRQAWYNREEMQAAFSACATAGGDEAKMQAAIDLLQAAHLHFQEITAAYATLRNEADALYAASGQSAFALLDSVRQIHADITAYWSAAGICGYLAVGAKVSECRFSGNITTGSRAGGIVGQMKFGTVDNCHSSGRLESGETRFIQGNPGPNGGIVAYTTPPADHNKPALISYCYSECYQTTRNQVGGILGYTGENVVGLTSIENCIAWNDFLKSLSAPKSGRISGRFMVGTAVGCWANPDMEWEISGNTDIGIDEGNITTPTTSNAGQSKGYNGTAATGTLIETARDVEFDPEIWDMSGERPVLKWEIE